MLDGVGFHKVDRRSMGRGAGCVLTLTHAPDRGAYETDLGGFFLDSMMISESVTSLGGH